MKIFLIPKKGGRKEIWGSDSCNLSKLTRIVTHNIFEKNLIVLFSQNNLNLTPLISALYVENQKSDVLLGLPGPIQNKFDPLYEKYKRKYFSLQCNKTFCYRNAFWCRGKICEEEDIIEEVEIEKKPIHGNRRFRNEYESDIEKHLEEGDFEEKPKIVAIPIKGYLPFQNFEDVELKYKSKKYNLKNFDPHLVILEEINERNFNFQSLLNLIEEFNLEEKKLILHFSWPYLPNLSEFLDTIEEKYSNSIILHLGKTLGREINKQTKEEKPDDQLLELSLEGVLWESIYNFNQSNFAEKINYIFKNINQQDSPSIKNFDSLLDEEFTTLRDSINEEGLSKTEINLLKYPPILNTFLPPNKLTRYHWEEEKYLPISEFLKINLGEREEVEHFKGLAYNLKPFDLGSYFAGLKTPSNIRKKTLLQMFLLNKIITIEKPMENNFVYLANLHPELGSRKALMEGIEVFLSHLKTKIVEIEKVIESRDISKIIKEVKDSKYLDLEVEDEGNSKVLKIKLSSPFNYVLGNYGIDKLNLQNCEATISKIRVINNRIRNKEFINEFEIDKISDRIKLSISTNQQSKSRSYIFKYKNLNNFRYISRERIKKSILLVPGTIPYHTIKEEKILITQGFDTFLLPFEKIIFFSYLGNNFKRLSSQIRSFEELLINEESDLYEKDLSYSLNYSNLLRLKGEENILSQIDSTSEIKMDKEENDDSTIDKILREDIVERDELENDTEKNNLKKLFEDVSMDEISSKGREDKPRKHYDRETNHVNFKMEFNDGSSSEVGFPDDSLIRKLEPERNRYVLHPVEELEPGDKITYIADRKTLDNELLEKFFSHVEYDLESILEPLTNLRTFYEELKSANFKFDGFGKKEIIRLGDTERENAEVEELTTEPFKKLKWLNESEKQILFNLIKNGFEENRKEFNKYFKKENNIWKTHMSEEDCWEILSAKNRISQSLLADLANALGCTLAKSTFKQYCSKNISEKKYYFKDPENVRVVGKLVGNSRVIKDYKDINRYGRKITGIIIKIGKCINRVISGKGKQGNEMDLYVKKHLRECTITQVKK